MGYDLNWQIDLDHDAHKIKCVYGADGDRYESDFRANFAVPVMR